MRTFMQQRVTKLPYPDSTKRRIRAGASVQSDRSIGFIDLSADSVALLSYCMDMQADLELTFRVY